MKPSNTSANNRLRRGLERLLRFMERRAALLKAQVESAEWERSFGSYRTWFRAENRCRVIREILG